MAPGKLPVPGRPTIWVIVGQGPAALAVGAGERVVKQHSEGTSESKSVRVKEARD